MQKYPYQYPRGGIFHLYVNTRKINEKSRAGINGYFYIKRTPYYGNGISTKYFSIFMYINF